MSTSAGPTVLALAIPALVLAGCSSSPGPVAIDAAAAERAAVEQLTGTFRYEVHVEDTLEGAARDVVDEALAGLDLSAAHMEGGVGADGSVQLRVTLDDAAPLPLFDARILLGDAVARLRSGEPAEVTATVQVDMVAVVVLLGEIFSAWSGEAPESDAAAREEAQQVIDDARDQARAAAPAEVFAVVEALLDGEHAGYAGTIDPADVDVDPGRLADGLGLTWLDPMQDLDVDTVTTALREATTLTADDPDPGTSADSAGGRSTFVVDVDTGRAAALLADLAGSNEAVLTAPLPEVLEEVATVAFDEDGDLVEVRIHLAAAVAQLPDAVGDAASTFAPARDEGQALDLVVTLSDHDDVDTVLSPTATTTGWEWALASYQDTRPSQAAVDATHAAIRALAVAVEAMETPPATLADVPAPLPDDVHLTLGWATADGAFCVSGYGTGDEPTGTYRFDSTTGEIVEGPCGAPPEGTVGGEDRDTSDAAGGAPVRTATVALDLDPDRDPDCARLATAASDAGLAVSSSSSVAGGCGLPPDLLVTARRYESTERAVDAADDLAQQVAPALLEVGGRVLDVTAMSNFDGTIALAVVDTTTTRLLKVETLDTAGDVAPAALERVLAELVLDLS